MTQINTYLETILDQSMQTIDRIVTIFSRITGLDDPTSRLTLLIIIIYLIVLIIISKIHRKLLKKLLKAKKNCTYEYDNIIYIIAKEELANNTASTVNPIQEILNSKYPNYLANHEIIINAIRKLEASTKQILLTPEAEKTINKLRKKIKNLKYLQKLFGIFLSIITIGIYLLFR